MPSLGALNPWPSPFVLRVEIINYLESLSVTIIKGRKLISEIWYMQYLLGMYNFVPLLN